jgi:hypothetical protein
LIFSAFKCRAQYYTPPDSNGEKTKRMKTFKPHPLSIWQKREALDEVAQPG